jgi:hypothetical protein
MTRHRRPLLLAVVLAATLPIAALAVLGLSACTPAQRDAAARDAAAFGFKGVRDILGAAMSLAATAPSNSDQWKTWAAGQSLKFGRSVVEEAGKLLAGSPPETVNALAAGQSMPQAPVTAAPTIGFHLPTNGTHASSEGGALGMTAGPAGASSGAAMAGSVSSTSSSDPRAAARWLVEHPDAW